MGTDTTFIKVFVTKSGRFRARVDYVVGPPKAIGVDLESRIIARKPFRRIEEITIGGNRWKSGYLEHLHTRILEKMNLTMYGLVSQCFLQSGSPTRIFLQNGKVQFVIENKTL